MPFIIPSYYSQKFCQCCMFLNSFGRVPIPLKPNSNYNYRVRKISFLKKEGIVEKNSYERRVYESVDDESLF